MPHGPVLCASSLLWPSGLAGVQHTAPPGVTGTGTKVTHLTGVIAGGHGRSRGTVRQCRDPAARPRETGTSQVLVMVPVPFCFCVPLYRTVA